MLARALRRNGGANGLISSFIETLSTHETLLSATATDIIGKLWLLSVPEETRLASSATLGYEPPGRCLEGSPQDTNIWRPFNLLALPLVIPVLAIVIPGDMPDGSIDIT